MNWIRRIFATPELSGLICGAAAYELLNLIGLEIPYVRLLVFSAAGAALAGALNVSCFRKSGQPVVGIIRRASVSGLWANAAFMLLMLTVLRFNVSVFSYRYFLYPLGCFMPAAMIGTLLIVITLRWLRLSPQSDEPVLPAPLPAWSRWAVWALNGLTLLWLLVAPFFPRSTRFDSRQSMSTGAAASHTPFNYTMPPELETVPKMGWQITQSRQLGIFQTSEGFSFSSDEKWFAAMEGRRQITVIDLDGDTRRSITSIDDIEQFALNPDGSKVFVVMNSNPRSIGVMLATEGRLVQLPQPKKFAVPSGAVAWLYENRVFFSNPGGRPLLLDLDNLEFDPAPTLERAERARWERERNPMLPSNDSWEFIVHRRIAAAELPETEGRRDWQWEVQQLLAIHDKKFDLMRLFPTQSVQEGDRWIGVENGSKVLRVRGTEVLALYFGTQAVPPLRWKINLPHAPDAMMEQQDTERALGRGDLCLVLYSPLINPLNSKTVGPDRQRPKGFFRVDRWNGDSAEIWCAQIYENFSPGDVFADFFITGTPPKLLTFKQSHRWWTLAPEPLPEAADVSKIPLPTELAKRRKDYEDAHPPPAPTPPVVPQKPPEPPLPQPDPAPLPIPTQEQLDRAFYEEVTAFVKLHHAKASRRELEDLAADYAEKVDYLDKGIVAQKFIIKDEIAYHDAFQSIREAVEAGLKIQRIQEGKVAVQYIMQSERIPKSSGKAIQRGRYQITLEMVSEVEGWRITKQRSTSLK